MNKITKKEKCLELIYKGINESADFITQTMGPGGKLVGVASFQKNKKSMFTKDGDKASEFLDKNKENMFETTLEATGASIITEAAQEMLKIVGDGTTTVTAILKGFIRASYSLILAGYNRNIIKEGLRKLPEIAKLEIEKIKEDIDNEKIKKVAHISSNGDPTISDPLSELVNQLGRDFVIIVEDSKDGNTRTALKEGFYFEKGPTSNLFFSKNEEQARMKIELEDCYILIVGEKFSNIRLFGDLISEIAPKGKPMIIVADDIDEEISAIFLTNKIKLGLNYICVKAPLFGEKKQQFLEDLALISGGEVLNPSKIDASEINVNKLGKAKKIVLSKDQTTIIDGGGSEENKTAKIEVIKELIKNCTSSYEKEKLQERLARLQNGIGFFYVGGATEIEISEKKDRVEDAIHSCRNAILGGIVPGAGSEFLWIYEQIKNNEILKLLSQNAFEGVLKTIVSNSEKASPDVVLKEIIEKNQKDCSFVFNGNTGVIETVKLSGIINPAKVSIEAIRIASSLAIQFVDLGALITENKEKKHNNNNNNFNYDEFA